MLVPPYGHSFLNDIWGLFEGNCFRKGHVFVWVCVGVCLLVTVCLVHLEFRLLLVWPPKTIRSTLKAACLIPDTNTPSPTPPPPPHVHRECVGSLYVRVWRCADNERRTGPCQMRSAPRDRAHTSTSVRKELISHNKIHCSAAQTRLAKDRGFVDLSGSSGLSTRRLCFSCSG